MSSRAPGEVRDAVVSVMRECDNKSLTVKEIHAMVERKLGGVVAKSSVRSYLQIGEASRWHRVARGRYAAKKRS